jgi:hypothetical protein
MLLLREFPLHTHVDMVTYETSSSPSTTSSGTTTPTGTGTKSAPSPIATSCLEMSNTQYSASNGKKFLRLCGLDYSGANEAKDIGNLKASTFEKCIELCAANEECTGAGWGEPVAGQKYRGTCWMKANMKGSHTAPDDWHFAVLLADAAPRSTSSSAAKSTS